MLRRIIIWGLLGVVAFYAMTAVVVFFAFRDEMPDLPPILEDLPEAGAEAEFNRRLDAAFAPDMTETALIAALRDQNFEVRPDLGRADFLWTDFPCQRGWMVLWQADAGRITSVDGREQRACL